MLSERQIRAAKQQLKRAYASADAEERTILQSVLELLKRVGGAAVERLTLRLAEYIVREGITNAARLIWAITTASPPPF
jgi:hypothetical protein